MITEHFTRPDKLSHLSGSGYHWIAGWDNRGTYAWAGLQLKANEGQLHLEVVRWSHNTWRALKRDWLELLAFCRQRECELIVVANKPGNQLWNKFIQKFGFPEPTNIILSILEVPDGPTTCMGS